MKYKIRYWVKDRDNILFHYLTTQETDKEKLLKHLKEDTGRTKEEIVIIEIEEVEEEKPCEPPTDEDPVFDLDRFRAYYLAEYDS